LDKVESLKFFVTIVEKGGIAIAGRDFGMSAATSSERLAVLEVHYGTKLINRTTRAISLTDEGRILYDGAKDLIEASSALESRIKFGAAKISGPIKISAPQDIGRQVISPLIDEFLQINSGVMIDLLLDDNNLDIVSHAIDVSVRLGPISTSSLNVKKLANNHRLLCAAPNYLETYGVPQHPSELSDHNCLVMQWGHVIDREWRFKVNGRKKSYFVSGNRSSNNGFHVKQWCLEGRGIALKSVWDVKNYISSGELVELLPEYSYDQNSAVQLIYPGGRDPTKRVQKLIDYLVQHFEKVSP